jgi:sec-independent protein translocase protein TatA
MPGFVGLPELLLLGLVVLLVFGPKRLPEMGRSMGHGLREFKDSISGDHKHDHETLTPARELDHVELVTVPAERDDRAA